MKGFVSFFVLLSLACTQPNYNNSCDFRSGAFVNTIALKIASGDSSRHCGFPLSLFASTFEISIAFDTNLTFKSSENASFAPKLSGTPTLFTITPSLPTGISINSNTGVISGIYSGYFGSKSSYTITASNGVSSSSTSTTITFFGRPPIKTYQTQCWNSGGIADATCGLATSTGQDGALQKGTVANFNGPTLVGSDYITTDLISGLVWNSCNDGRSGASCSLGTYTQPNWAGANTNCSALNSANSGQGYASIKTWRLPTPEELETLVNYNTTSPATFTSNFPNTTPGANTWHWTSLSDPANSAINAWWVYFTDGQMGPVGTKTTVNQYYVRCVSDGTSTNSSSLMIDNGNGTITDIHKSLVWQKCSMGQSATTCSGTATTSSWATALQSCNGLTLANKTWRLPNINELKTIIDRRTGVVPYIQNSSNLFVSTPTAEYWSSTTDLGTPATGNAWVTFYNGGTVYAATKAATDKYTRCVSDP